MTGALSGRESPEDLYRMALDPEYWDRIEELAASPAAWPDFRRWADEAVQVGPELSGEPPAPPERNRSIWPFRRTPVGRQPGPVPVKHPDAEATQILPVIVPTEQPAGAGDERPRRAVRGILRNLSKPLALSLAAVLLVCGGYLAVARTVRMRDEQTALAAADQRRERAEKLAKARNDAGNLLKMVAASPVAGDETLVRPQEQVRQALDDGMTADQADRIEQAGVRLSKVWGSLMDAKAEATTKSLKLLVGRSDALGDAPDSADRRSMTGLADVWRGRKVGRSDLSVALKAEADLGRLAASVQADRDRQVREREEDRPRSEFRPETQERPRTGQPRRTDPPRRRQEAAPAAPRRQGGQSSAPPAEGGAGQGDGQPSWSVPAPSGPDPGLPGRDPGL